MKEGVANHLDISDIDIKERIIRATISLIENSDGLVENITVREIARKAGVAVGLINYHFLSKQNLLETCVQRIISQFMAGFSPDKSPEDEGERADKDSHGIGSFTKSVFSFLLKHPEISKISMLGDLSHPDTGSNSSVSFRAIFKAMPETEAEDRRRIKSFILLSTIQSAFLNRQISAELLGFDLRLKEDYSRFFRLVADILQIS